MMIMTICTFKLPPFRVKEGVKNVKTVKFNELIKSRQMKKVKSFDMAHTITVNQQHYASIKNSTVVKNKYVIYVNKTIFWINEKPLIQYSKYSKDKQFFHLSNK